MGATESDTPWEVGLKVLSVDLLECFTFLGSKPFCDLFGTILNPAMTALEYLSAYMGISSMVESID